MAGTRILLDTGPLVGYLNEKDQHHEWAVSCWASLYDPVLTCESVLSEAIFSLESEQVGPEPILELLERGIIRVAFSLPENQPDVMQLLRKYADQAISLADACLIRMTEKDDRCRVFTTDKDFKVYRRFGRQIIRLLAPFQH
jgi:predicted nucleic acid-binding protein